MKAVFLKRKRLIVFSGVLILLIIFLRGRSSSVDEGGEEELVAVERNGRKPAVFLTEEYGNFEPSDADEEDEDGPAQRGRPYHLPAGKKKEAERSIAKYGFNLLASEDISLTRSLRDTRPKECKHWNYPENMGLKASVVIVFRNEGLSVLMRNVKQILKRSPKSMLEEIILVDDLSSFEELKSGLDSYIEKNFPEGTIPVRVIRNAEREGLIRSRSIGAKAAVGDVIVFLDAHCEVNKNWLPPLLAPIYENRKTLTIPFVDSIDWNTFEYRPTYAEGARFRGAFEWGFFYKELELTGKMADEYSHKSMPYKAPNHAGGLLAIDRKYFLEIGAYDPGLLIWGGENFELSFKVWMCGGSQVWVPCSRVGHIYRGPRTVRDDLGEKWEKIQREKGSLTMLNYKRVIDVWFDEKHKEYFYAREPLARFIDPGDLSEQIAFRDRSHCKSFQWFMDNVAPDIYVKYPPPPKNKKWGELRNLGRNRCVDTMGRGVPGILGVYHCHGQGTNQLVRLNVRGQMGIGERCVDMHGGEEKYVQLTYCPDGVVSGPWDYDEGTGRIRHQSRGKCLGVDVGGSRNDDLILIDCDEDDENQRWLFKEVRPKNG